ncbi:MAG TPA: sodium:proton exchanger [Polyangiaceae bacterium]|nr:sodium:proton exchanger [Polyangiaceae bacterium]
MSGHGGGHKGFGTRLIQAVALAVTFGLLYSATKLAPQLEGELGTVAGVGFLLLAGTLLSELLETIGLPHLSGYLLAGIIGGPDVLHLVDHHTVNALTPVNTLAIAMIALAGGAELRMSTIRGVAKSLSYAMVVQTVLVLAGMSATLFVLARFVPFLADLAAKPLLGVALLWGVVSITRSPSACMGILSQTRAKGPVATFALAFIMSSDIVVVVLTAVGMMVARPLIAGSGGFSFHDIEKLGHELLGSISFGTTLGLALGAYLRLIGQRGLLLVLLAVGFGLTDFLRYVTLDATLAFMVAGFVVQNLTAQGGKLLHSIEVTGAVVYVVFFANAGAHLNIPLLQKLWPIALTLCVTRGLITYAAARLSSHLADDTPAIRTWGWSSLVSQAGLALGIGLGIAKAFPTIGEGFSSMVIAAVAINEMIGPVLFKMALDRSGETRTSEAEVSRTSLLPPDPA